jgi:anti-sigma factor RsiW
MPRSCRVERYLTAYADGELPERIRRRVESHLERCDSCARELDSIRASDRILREHTPPAVSEERWAQFRLGLRRELDSVDRAGTRRTRIVEARPIYVPVQRRALAFATAVAVVVLAIMAIGPASPFRWPWSDAVAANECFVDSIESLTAGYTPMYFSSEDPEMTVIWVFSEEVEGGIRGEGPGAR